MSTWQTEPTLQQSIARQLRIAQYQIEQQARERALKRITRRENANDAAVRDYQAARAELAKSANPAVWNDIAAQRIALNEALFFATGGYSRPAWDQHPDDPLYQQAVERRINQIGDIDGGEEKTTVEMGIPGSPELRVVA
jgi:hypothetical protein